MVFFIFQVRKKKKIFFKSEILKKEFRNFSIVEIVANFAVTTKKSFLLIVEIAENKSVKVALCLKIENKYY